MAAGAKRFSRVAVGGAIGGLYGLLLVGVIPDNPPGTGLLWFLGLQIFAVFLHEMGHIGGALAVRFRVLAFTIAGISLWRYGTGFRLRAMRRLTVGGFVMAVPRGTDDLPLRLAVFVASGPVASLLGAAAGFVMASSRQWTGLWMAWLYTSLMFTALSLFPTNRGPYRSDGSRLLVLLRGGARADRSAAVMIISSAASAGIRPREWDAQLIERALSGARGEADEISFTLIAYEAAMDRRELARAGDYLKRAQELFEDNPPPVQAAIAGDSAFYEGVVRKDAVAARSWFEKCNPKLLTDRYARLQIEAAVLIAEERVREAKSKATQALAELPQATFAGYAKSSEDWLREMVAQCERTDVPTVTV